MKRKLQLCIAVLFLLLLSGCSEPSGIVGTWEEELQVTILGIEQEAAQASAVTRFTFRKDGTGSWGTSFADDSHPEAVREFCYALEEDALTLHYEEATADTVFNVTLEENVLKLENPRGSFQLSRVK